MLQSAYVNEEALRSRSATPGSTSVLSASTCEFCTIPGHTIASCHRLQREKDRAAQEVAERRKQRVKGKANVAASKETAAQASAPTEYAGQAAARSSSSSIPLDHAAHAFWTADTGAAAHMTPHRRWLRNYTPSHRYPPRQQLHRLLRGRGECRLRACDWGRVCASGGVQQAAACS